VNFYKHHLGDYDGATAHLDWFEDMAYTRLLRAYYRRESPIPLDVGAACRLVRAASPAQRKAVETVLAEFFERKEDGWYNKRADEEITAYQRQASTNRRIARERSSNEPCNEPSDGSSTKGIPNQEPDTRTRSQEPEKSGKPAALRADVDPEKQEIWNTGKAMLGKEGASFLGKLVKDYGQKLVLQAIRDCKATQPVSPKEWLVARCQERRGNGTGINKQEALEERNRRTLENWQPPAEDVHG
jgi:uncharacterized protein YdaU (DUF1376 family)